VTVTPVVMAAGEGTRLRPLTDRWPKTLLPIDGRPVISILLRELASADFDHVVVVTGHLAEQVEALVGDGSAFGLSVSFVRQPEALGSADAVVRALDAGARTPLLVTAADTVFVRGDLRRITAAWAASGASGAVGVRRGGRPDQTRVRVDEGRVAELAGNAGSHTATPIWLLGEELAKGVRAVPGPPFEIAHAVQEAIAANKEILAFEMGATRDLTRPTDVMAHNFPYLLRDGK
jgi:NDP-sugar pyrophosphorylase family protein